MIFRYKTDFDFSHFDTVLFDLDGTLTQSGIGITRAAQYALSEYGIEKQPEELTHLIGPPLQKAFMECYGFTQADAAEAVRLFRVYYLDRGWKENTPYPGVDALLKGLKDAGKTLAVATSKPEDTAVQILEYFYFAEYFDLICGPTMTEPEHAGKVVIILDAFARLGLSDTSRCVMIGDRKHDIIGAHKAGIPGIGVLYGYGSRQELEGEQAEAICETIADLADAFNITDLSF